MNNREPSDSPAEQQHDSDEVRPKRALSPKEQYLEQMIAEDYASLGDGARRELFED